MQCHPCKDLALPLPGGPMLCVCSLRVLPPQPLRDPMQSSHAQRTLTTLYCPNRPPLDYGGLINAILSQLRVYTGGHWLREGVATHNTSLCCGNIF